MSNTTLTTVQLTDAIKAYRSFGSKIRAEVKASKPDLFIDRNRRFQKVLVGKLAEAGHMDLVLALADEQVGLDGIAFAKALYPSYEATSRELLRNARRKVAAILSDVEADEASEQDLTTVTLTELVTRRRAAAEVFRRQERPTDDEIVSAARTIDTVDAELIERDQGMVQDLLVAENTLLISAEHAERKGYKLDAYQVTDLANTTSSIEGALRLFGHTDGTR